MLIIMSLSSSMPYNKIKDLHDVTITDRIVSTDITHKIASKLCGHGRGFLALTMQLRSFNGQWLNWVEAASVYAWHT